MCDVPKVPAERIPLRKLQPDCSEGYPTSSCLLPRMTFRRVLFLPSFTSLSFTFS